MPKKKTKNTDDTLFFDFEDVQGFVDGCTSIGMELNLPSTGNGIDPDDNYGTQSYYFSIIENEDTQVGVNFSLDQCGDSIVLEYNIDYSSKIEGLEDKIDEVTDDELPAIGEFSSEHNSPLEVIRDNTSEVMDLIESKLHEIVDDLQSAGLL